LIEDEEKIEIINANQINIGKKRGRFPFFYAPLIFIILGMSSAILLTILLLLL